MILLDRATTTPSVPPTVSSWVLAAGGGPSDAAFLAGAALASLDTLARAQVIRRRWSHVTNTLKLLKLPDVVQDMLVSGALSAGRARTLDAGPVGDGVLEGVAEGWQVTLDAPLRVQANGACDPSSGQARGPDGYVQPFEVSAPFCRVRRLESRQ